MIVLVCAPGETQPMGKFVRGTPALRATIQIVTYDALLSAANAPIAHYIFADHDRLEPAVLERAARLAAAVRAAEPDARILNHPLRTLERYALVRTLADLGLGAFDLVRLDEGRLPRFPAFIRSEAGTSRAETPLLVNEQEFAAALAALEADGRTRKGRVAVEFVDTRSADGRFRKYGVLRVGERLVPQHLFVADQWCVKGGAARTDRDSAAEELAFVRAPLPEAELRRIFDVAAIEYGRLDYALRDGRLVPFEINTNPSLPRPGTGDLRGERRRIVCDALAGAFRALDRPLGRPRVLPMPDNVRSPGITRRLAARLRALAIETSIADSHFRRRRRRRFPQ